MATTVTLKPNAIDLSGSTSGTTTLKATAVAGTTTITLPAATDTLVGKATTDTLTNKTLTAPTLASANITTALTLTGASGTNGQVLTSAGTGAAPTWSSPSTTSISNGTSNVTVNSSGGTITATTAGTTAVTIDTSQNVGIDQTSPTSKFVVGGGASAGSTNWGHFRGNCGASSPPSSDPYGVWFGSNYSNGNNEGNIAYNYALTTASWDGTTYTERMRIDSSGNTLMGTTSNYRAARLRVDGQETAYFTGYGNGYGIGLWMTPNASAGGGTADPIKFQNVSNTTVGSISTTASATSYNTSSDYRLKENIAPMTGALAKVAALKPVTYKWNADGSNGEGFIAHELAEVVPNCVTGAKDAVDADGNPVYQGIDTSFLVATLTAAIQELSAKNDALTARIVALEAK